MKRGVARRKEGCYVRIRKSAHVRADANVVVSANSSVAAALVRKSQISIRKTSGSEFGARFGFFQHPYTNAILRLVSKAD